jgi:hypothetical protein
MIRNLVIISAFAAALQPLPQWRSSPQVFLLVHRTGESGCAGWVERRSPGGLWFDAGSQRGASSSFTD